MHLRTSARTVLCVASAALLVGGCTGHRDTRSGAAPATSDSSGAARPPVSPSPSGATSTSGSPTARRTAGPPARRPPITSVAVSSLPPVPVGHGAALTAGVSVTISGVRDIDVGASGPGEIAGHAVSIQVRVHNATSAAFDLSGLAVVASYGRGTPASPTNSGGAKPLTGTLATGGTADGTYVFLVPAEQSTTLRVEVSSAESPNIAVFQR